MNGLAGTGKSTIAKTIAARLFADGQLGASFFCSRDFEDRRNLQLIFPTLATQLARKYAEFRSILVPLIRSDPEVAYESLYDQMEKLIVHPLNETGISTVIIIDALDECEDEDSASAILSVLGRLVSKIPKVKLILTGRPEPRISEGFRLPLLAKMTEVFVLHNVEPDQVESDIRLFFKSSLSELADRRRGLDGWPTGEHLDQLCGRAAGLFVYAAATVKFIDNNKRDPRKQLDLLLRSQKVGVHEGKSLDSLYTSILREAFGDDGPEDDAKTRSILGAVVLATNPLSPPAIAMLLGFDAEDVPSLLSSVNSLLILREDPKYPVRPFHKSFPDFVTDPTRCTNPRFHISPPDHHLQLLIGCLGLMNRTLEKNMCKLPDGVANSDVSDLKERTERYINPALRYACISWHTHLVCVDTVPTQAPAITLTLRQFLETNFLFWLEILSVLGAVRNAVEALQATTEWLEVCRVSMLRLTKSYSDRIQESPTLDLVNDCYRFVTGYFEIISASSPHIYHTALVVGPKNSIVQKLYKSHSHPFTRIVRGLPISWDPNTAATIRPLRTESAIWSPCDRFIAVTWDGPTTPVDILDSTTLQRLQTLEFPQRMPMGYRALIFSPDSRILTCSSGDPIFHREVFVVSWDLQTGGIVGVISSTVLARSAAVTPSITYSANGKMIGIAYCSSYCRDSVIFICDVASNVLMHSHPLNDTVMLSGRIWTHGESLRFATVDATTITIWEVGFISGATPTKAETLPAPDCSGCECLEDIQFHPAPFRLAFVSQGRIFVWDPQCSRYMLECADAEFQRPRMTFSSDGRFFACSTAGSDIYLWKESPTGYTLHGVLTSSAEHPDTFFAQPGEHPNPLLARNGESIAGFFGRAIKLWHTKIFATLPSGIPARALRLTEGFLLEFSPDGVLAVVAMREGNTVTVLNLRSGVPQLSINAGMEVYGLGVIGNTVVVIGDPMVIAWNLPTRDRVSDAWVGPEDSSWTINLSDPPKTSNITSASISPDSRHIARISEHHLYIYSASTGNRLAREPTEKHTPRFSPDGHHVWCAGDSGEAEAWEVGNKQNTLETLHSKVSTKCPPEGYPWASSRGYHVTDDQWILGPDGKRLLMLPPHWQSYAVRRVWKGEFLAFLHGGLLEPIILELEVNSDM